MIDAQRFANDAPFCSVVTDQDGNDALLIGGRVVSVDPPEAAAGISIALRRSVSPDFVAGLGASVLSTRNQPMEEAAAVGGLFAGGASELAARVA